MLLNCWSIALICVVKYDCIVHITIFKKVFINIHEMLKTSTSNSSVQLPNIKIDSSLRYFVNYGNHMSCQICTQIHNIYICWLFSADCCVKTVCLSAAGIRPTKYYIDSR